MRWGIIGLGEIAERFASELPRSAAGTLQAVGSRDRSRARRFADKHGAPLHYDNYADLLADEEVDAVYIALPHPSHPEWAIRAAEQGKHVLSEKPLAPTHAQAMAMIEAAHRNGVALVEGYMYRFNPRTAELLRLVQEGAIGEVLHIEAVYTFRAANTDGRLFDPALAGGAILDVGGYPASLALGLASAALGGLPAITQFAAGGSVVDGVDRWATATLQFGGRISAHLTAGIAVEPDHTVRIYGTEGMISMPDPWLSDAEDSVLVVNRVDAPIRRVVSERTPQFAAEADAVVEAARENGQAARMSWDESLEVAALLDRWRKTLGVQYPFERQDSFIPVVHGSSLRRDNSRMRYGRMQGVDKPIARLVMGCDNQTDLSHASVMFDDYMERGGNAFDSAREYGDGYQERLLGQWMANRGVRDDVFLIGKGAHTPYCDPANLSAQLMESLDHLQTDHVDLYLIHRDNPDIPVGEFIDVLDEHYRGGRIREFGVSNWTIERFEEANSYAVAHGKRALSALSNHFGLAQAQELPWDGCRHATDEASKKWLQRTQTPLFAWSSQARGFFARADPADMTDSEMVRCYYSADNFERLQRVRAIAASRGVSPTSVALAYVLHQPFPTFALIGPRRLSETRTSMETLELELSPREVEWLDLRA